MNIEEWLVSKLSTSSIAIYTTIIKPEFLPIGTNPPAIIYNSIGFDVNRKQKMRVLSLTSLHNSKSQVEALNDALYTLFDTSTAYFRESSSNLYIDSATILQNGEGGFDNENKYWYRVLDIRFWYH